MRTTADPDQRRWLRWLLPPGIILAGVLIALGLILTRPEPKTREPGHQARLVTVSEVRRRDATAHLEASGEVVPARSVELQPRVSGSVQRLGASFVPGATVNEGDLLVRIDPTDYALAVEQRRSELERAKADLQLEQGRQVVARQEYEMMDEQVSPDEKALILRQPQLQQTRAAVDSARAALEQARLNLERTRLRAPFDAVVLSREVNRGAQIASNTTVARLAGIDAYWVELSVPVSQLPWVRLPGESGPASKVTLHHDGVWADNTGRVGRVLRLRGKLEESGRMARLLVEVRDPLARAPENNGKPRLLLGSFVRAEIAGDPLKDVIALKRAWLRNQDQVWIMNQKDQLEIRDVQVVLRSAGTVYVRDGIRDGERVVTSSISVPAPGMPLRLNGTSGTDGGTQEPDS